MIVSPFSTRVSSLIGGGPPLVMSADRLEFPIRLAVVLPPILAVPFEKEDGPLKAALEIVLGLEIDTGVVSVLVV